MTRHLLAVVGLVVGVAGASPAVATPVDYLLPGEVLAATASCQFATAVAEGGKTRRLMKHLASDVTTWTSTVADVRIARTLRGPASALVMRKDGTGLHLDALTCAVTEVPAPTGRDVIVGRAPYPTGFVQARAAEGRDVVLERCDLAGVCAPPRGGLTVAYSVNLLPSVVQPAEDTRDARVTPPAWSATLATDGRRVALDGPFYGFGGGASVQGRFGVDLDAGPTDRLLTALPDLVTFRPATRQDMPEPATTQPGSPAEPSAPRALWVHPRAYVYAHTHGSPPSRPGEPAQVQRQVRIKPINGAPRTVGSGAVTQVTYTESGAVWLDDAGLVHVPPPSGGESLTLPGTYSSVTSDGTHAYALGGPRGTEQVLYRLDSPTTLVAVARVSR